MPCDCHGFVVEEALSPVEHPDDVVTLPMQYRHSECYGTNLGWYQYAWDEQLADEQILARYAHVLDVEIIQNVTWTQAIAMVAGNRQDEDAQ